ncbi:hypothetical protein [Cypionkella sp.]|uniref:hypothetical protein n=1 Tax=Cypionkella sp. TaxID=2811411 RepID=UPI0027170D3C|nr:hypothetical protein [Cypionkella sp.]MDO8982319.1 hypothetical protein [Cypionkella sp.]MDP1578583.1 hypothetical protein [Cypionkella sp.]
MQKPTKWTGPNVLLSGRMACCLWVLSFAVVLLCGLIIGQSASAFATVDHHTPTSVEASDDSAGSTNMSLSCHPALACTAFVIPTGAVPAFISNFAAVSRPDFAQTTLRFGGPSVSLPPPRLLT